MSEVCHHFSLKNTRKPLLPTVETSTPDFPLPCPFSQDQAPCQVFTPGQPSCLPNLLLSQRQERKPVTWGAHAGSGRAELQWFLLPYSIIFVVLQQLCKLTHAQTCQRIKTAGARAELKMLLFPPERSIPKSSNKCMQEPKLEPTALCPQPSSLPAQSLISQSHPSCIYLPKTNFFPETRQEDNCFYFHTTAHKI